MIRLKRTAETFPGAHEPLIDNSLFDRVQRVFDGKTNTRSQRHCLLFRRLLTCKSYGYSLIGEIEKEHTYYRCHTKACPMTGIREETVDDEILRTLSTLQFSEEEKAYFRMKAAHLLENWDKERETEITALNLKLSQTQDRLHRLTDAYIDQAIDRDIFEERKAALLMARKDMEDRLSRLKDNNGVIADRLSDFLELAGSAYLSYKMGLPEEKRIC